MVIRHFSKTRGGWTDNLAWLRYGLQMVWPQDVSAAKNVGSRVSLTFYVCLKCPSVLKQ